MNLITKVSRLAIPVTLFFLSTGFANAQSYIIGPASPAIGTSDSYTSFNHLEIFDVLNPTGVIIDSLDIYPTVGAIGSPFTIVIQNSSQAVIASYSGVTTVSGGTTPQRVKINLTVPQGTGYRLGLSLNPGMIRNSTGAVYPYTVPGLMSITGNTYLATYYYFFYNIRIMYPNFAGDAGITSFISPDDTTCSGSMPVTVRLKNFGATNLSNVQINWKVNNVPQTLFAWSGNLAPGDSTSINIGSYAFAVGTSYNVFAATNNPNGLADLVPSNDSASREVIHVKTSPTGTPFGTAYSICLGDSVQIGGTITGVPPYTLVINDGSANYTYPNLMVPGFAQYVIPASTTTYTIVSLTDATGCSNTSIPPIIVTVLPYPTAVVTVFGPTTFCQGDSIFLQANQSPGYIYSWYRDGVLIPNQTNSFLIVNSSGSYRLTTTVGTCSDNSNIVNITVNPAPVFSLGSDTVLCAHSSIVLNAGSNNTSYQWSTGAGTQTITVDTAGMGIGSTTISVFVTLNGCNKSDTVNITFVDCTGIEENSSLNSLQVFPNPSDGMFWLHGDTGDEKYFLEIQSLEGKVIMKSQISLSENSDYLLDLRHLPGSIYLLKVQHRDQSKVIRLVLQ